jgi:hypothetical protein
MDLKTDETSSSDFKNIRTTIDPATIKGWGVDADPENDPTYPMKKRTDEEIRGYSWVRPSQQPVTVEILKSVERPNITAVYGTSTPPSGLSGQIRRFAFKYSESSYGHWLPLVLADRINVVEGIIEDIKRGHFPNVIAERGWTAEWKYNKRGVVKTALAGIVIASAALAILGLTRSSKR